VTRRQRQLVREWLIGGGILLAFIVFDSFAERNAWWLRIVCMTGAMIGLAGRSKFELASAGSERIADVVDEAPWVKVWVCVWAVAISAGAIYVIKRSIDLESLGIFRVILIPFAIILAPFVMVNERRKFNELGEIDGAT
jgi:hypothetical protein